jgi:anti-sigma regulatory factor (Ser/Thr protein kinase)
VLIAELDAGLAGEGLPASVIHDLHLVVEEVACNVLDHGAGDREPPTLDVEARVDGRRLALVFRDTGLPFDPLDQPPPDLDADICDRPIGGLGVHLIRQLAEELFYVRDQDTNVLRVVLHIPNEDPAR